MGIVNVTPDSFSDGGRIADTDSAVAHGAAARRRRRRHPRHRRRIDPAGLRPGAGSTTSWRRVVPVIERLAERVARAHQSIDTTKAVVARAALDAGAALVNDVTALRGDPAMAALVAERGCPRVPHAHARRAAHHAGRPALRRRGRRGRSPSSSSAWPSPSPPACARSRSCSTPASASARPLRHNLLLLPDLAPPRGSGPPRRCWAPRASASSAPCSARSRTSASSAPWPPPCWASHAARPSCRVHDVQPNVEALRVALAVLDARSRHRLAGRAPAEPRSPARRPSRSRSPPSRRPATAA